ncbi:hypothetical protein [Streptomyces violascens]|uniref:hypothetical protein n=1 Tax=Streptomyces violascens TaxID=67381 RepID=UPI0036B144B5
MVPRPLRRRSSRLAGPALAATLALAVNGCAWQGSSHTPRAPGDASTPAPTESSSTTARTFTLDEHDRGRVVQVNAGARVVIRLHTTYWSPPTSSDTRTLAPDGRSHSAPTGNCEPGAGCGTVAAGFTALRTGTAQILSHRNSCGEAMRCPSGQGVYAVTIKVA